MRIGSKPLLSNLHSSLTVSWKADGTRYLMLINGENQVYFADRDNNIFAVENLGFPQR